MEVKFRCTHCHRKLEADATLAGTSLACPNCSAEVTIPDARLGPDVTLGGFRIERLVGKGAMGEVFLAKQLAMDRRVALKVLPGRLVSDSDFVERFFHEVRTAAKLQHPGIVSAYDAGMDHGYYYFAMAYVDGVTLESRLRREEKLPEKEALGICIGIGEALAYAWDHGGILHRDIKPSNIMVTHDGQPMIMDMGIAKSVGDDSHITATGVAIGTPHYMSPEQAKGSHHLDFRTDMYSLGATLFHLVTGTVPFAGNSAMEVVARHLHEPLPSARSIDSGISQAFDELVLRMMAKEKRDRYPSWEACIGDMRAVLRGKTPETAKERVARQAGERLAQQRQVEGGRGGVTGWVRTPLAPWVVAALCLFLAILAMLLFVLREVRKPAFSGEERVLRASPRVGVPSASEESVARIEPAPAEDAVPAAEEGGADASVTPAPPGAGPEPPAAEGTTPRPLSAVPTTDQPTAPPATDPDTAAAAGEPSGPDPPATTGDANPPGAAAAAARDPVLPVLNRVAAEWVGGHLAAATAAWEEGSKGLQDRVLPLRLDRIAESVAYVANVEPLILESFRRDVGRTINLRLRGRTCSVVVRSVTPPSVRVMEPLEHGAVGHTIGCRDLSMEEKLTRVGVPDSPDAALARGLIALWDDHVDLARSELRRFDTPLSAAVLARVDALEAHQREKLADHAFGEMVTGLLRGSVPRDAAGLMAALRERLSSDRRRKVLTGWVKSFEETHGATETGRQRLAFLREVMAYPFEGDGWTVPDHGLEFVWLEALGFWVGKYEVTNAQFRRFFREHDSGQEGGQSLNGDDSPAVCISFHDAEGYAAFLTEGEGRAGRLPEDCVYRLPTHDEWTAFATCGDGRKFPWGPEWPPPASCNYHGTEWQGPEASRLKEHTDPFPCTCTVTASGANPWGLHGVGGNAFEWTVGANGVTPELRGGGWRSLGTAPPSPADFTVAATRTQPARAYRGTHTGFRLVLAKKPGTAPQPAAAKP
ncbi:MAG: protein kinase [Lentisphaeria bacterium]|nr:protein kinase [Lentisphaeria bacterium]